MEENITVWTKQSEKIVDTLNTTGRHIAKKEYIEEKMEDHANLYIDSYTWFTNRASQYMDKPDDVKFPVWVSLSHEEAIGHVPGDGTVLLEIEVPKEKVLIFDLEKWGCVVNYQYIPLNEEDLERHEQKLKQHGIDDDSTAYMSNFYPSLKQEIIKSWDRLFDDSIRVSDVDVGTMWEVKKEWVKKIS